MKQTILQIYSRTNTHLLTTAKFGFSNFEMSINYGVGSSTIELPYTIDNYDTTIFKRMNRVKLKVADNDNPNGVIVYSGYIADIKGSYSGNISLECNGLMARTSRIPLTYISTPLDGVYDTGLNDIGLNLRTILNNYSTRETNLPINNNTTTIPNISVNRRYVFDSVFIKDAIDAITETLPANRYVYLDNDDFYYLKTYASTPNHYLIMNKHINDADIEYSTDGLTNQLLFWNGLPVGNANLVQKRYQDATSITEFGIHAEIKRDERYKLIASADDYGNRLIANKKDPKPSVKITVYDNSYSNKGYNIESIKPGDVIKVINVAVGNPINTAMIVTSISYQFDKIVLSCEDRKVYLAQKLFEIENKAREDQFISTARTYTT